MRETFPRLVSPNGSIQRPEEDRSIPIVDIDFRHADEFSEFRFPDWWCKTFTFLCNEKTSDSRPDFRFDI